MALGELLRQGPQASCGPLLSPWFFAGLRVRAMPAAVSARHPWSQREQTHPPQPASTWWGPVTWFRPKTMRVALKLVLATVLGTVAVLIIFGWVRASREVELFDSDMRKDHVLVGTTLAVCVADEWAAAGQERALQLVKQADEERPHMRLGFVHPDGTQSDVAPGRAVKHQVVDRMEDFVTTEVDEPDEEFLVTRVPVHGRHGELLGAVEIAERLGVRSEFIRSNIVGTLAVTLAMVGFSGCVVLLIGVWLVGLALNLAAA